MRILNGDCKGRMRTWWRIILADYMKDGLDWNALLNVENKCFFDDSCADLFISAERRTSFERWF